MKTTSKTNKFEMPIINWFNSITQLVIGLITLFSMGITVGIYYETIQSNKEISELNNKHTLEIIELRNKQTEETVNANNKHTLEIVQLNSIITLLNSKNEKGK